MPQDPTGDESLNSLLDELEARAQQQQSSQEQADDYWVCKRRHPRTPLRVRCRIRFLPPNKREVMIVPGHTRNISRGGVGLLTRRMFRSGEAVEVEILVPDRSPMYMAGLVTFCRYTERGWHEIGVCLRVAGSTSIFADLPSAVSQTQTWTLPTEPAPTPSQQA